MPDPPLTPVPTLQRLCAELIALRERNDRQHKLFEQTLSQTRDDLRTRFDKFAAEAQSAYQRLRDELTGEKRLSLALLTTLLDLTLDIQKVADARMPPDADLAERSRRSHVVLAQFGVHRYDAIIGSAYEPALHERVGSHSAEGMGPLRVAAQVEPGYASQQPDFVLRRARVLISDRVRCADQSAMVRTADPTDMPYIGIDFGTSNSVVADFQFGKPVVLPNHEGQLATPSVVTLRRDGSLAFGQEAKENFDASRSIRSIKRVLGSGQRVAVAGQELRPEQVAVMLFSLLKRDAETVLRQPIQKAVVTIPANSKGLARHATKLCAGAAGLQVLTLINEPTAAAICYGLDSHAEQTVLVYDFGGGTLDVTVLRVHHGIFEEIGSKGVGKLGGDDLDEALAAYLADRFQQKTGYDILNSPYRTPFLMAVERAKIALSGELTTVAWAPNLVPERHLSLQEPLERVEFERVIMPFVLQSGGAIEEALDRANLKPRDVDRVILVGGTSKIPRVRRYVAEKLFRNPEPFDKVDPMTCVAQGAGIVSAILQGAPGLDHYAYSVKLEHSLCANPIDDRGQPFLDPIIKRGTDIPCSLSKKYFPVADPAERVTVSVYEGDVYHDPDDPENVKLAEIPWEFDPPRPQADAGIDVTFVYGDDGILTVAIDDPIGNRRQRFAIQHASAEPMTQQQVEKMGEINQTLVERTERFEASPQYRDALEVLRKAEATILPRLGDAGERQELEAMCRQVRQAMAAGDLAQMEEVTVLLSDRLLNYAYLL